MTLSRPSIVIADYDPRWPSLYEEERARIVAAIGNWLVDIQHVGSTSVPGLAAKPVIDIGVALGSLLDGLKCITPLVELGYECLGEYGIRGRLYFRKLTSNPLPGQLLGAETRVGRTHQMHMYERTHPEWEAHILFRDFLRTHADVAARYEALKRQLAGHHDDVEAYAEAKASFVSDVLKGAGFTRARRTG
jgi:GrpB-like predicted nucleotidyltransferase (UPF0157 family)